jgi:hypothetical protein
MSVELGLVSVTSRTDWADWKGYTHVLPSLWLGIVSIIEGICFLANGCTSAISLQTCVETQTM